MRRKATPVAPWEFCTEALQAGLVQLCLESVGTCFFSQTWKVRVGTHHIQRLLLFPSQNFLMFLGGILMSGFWGVGNTDFSGGKVTAYQNALGRMPDLSA